MLVYGIWTFGLAFLLFYILNRIIPFRVSKEEELVGLNYSEHGIQHEDELNNASLVGERNE